MTKDAIDSFFFQALGRQNMFGPQDAFRFKGYVDREGKVVEALYPVGTDAETDEEPAVRSSKKGSEKIKRKGKGKAKATNIQPNEDLGGRLSGEAVPPEGGAVESGPSHSPTHDFITITHHDMSLLIAQGYPPQAPINGPNEGMPEYVVPRLEWLKINRVPKPRPRPIPPCHIDPVLLEDTYNPTRVRGSLLSGTALTTACGTGTCLPSTAPGISTASDAAIISVDGIPPLSPSVSGPASGQSSIPESNDIQDMPSSNPQAGSAVIKKKRKCGDALALQEARKLLPQRRSKRLKTNKK